MNLERRYNGEKVNVERRDGETPPRIIGYGAVFDSRSEDLGGFTELIAPGAFDTVLENDVRALFNHDDNFVLGRTASGTMTLSVDEVGLRYEVIPPDTQLIRDMVIAPMERGDISQSSFGFFVEEDDWKENRAGEVVRTITKVSRLLDVSPVTYPAYPDTSVAMRKLKQITEAGNDIAIPDGDIIELLDSASKILEGSTSQNYRSLYAVLEKAQNEIVQLRATSERQQNAIALFRRLANLSA